MPLLPSLFLFRLSHACPYLQDMPRAAGDELLELPASCRLDNVGTMDGQKNFADVRVAWNALGLGVRVEVRGKKETPQGDISRPRASDGVTLWIDTRDSRSSHRASRYCHQFHLLPLAGDEPAFVQSKIHRALHDAPLIQAGAVPFRGQLVRGGYLVECFLPATALNGFDPEQNRKLGFFYDVRDLELGEQNAGLDGDFPFAEDPTLWSVLELID